MATRKDAEGLEKTLQAHRYCYYVNDAPVISDYDYDRLERQLLDFYEDHYLEPASTSILNTVGSSLASSYSQEVRDYAKELSSV